MEVVVTTGAIRRAKLQSNHHHQQTNTQLLQAFLLPNQQYQSTLGKYIYLLTEMNSKAKINILTLIHDLN